MNVENINFADYVFLTHPGNVYNWHAVGIQIMLSTNEHLYVIICLYAAVLYMIFRTHKSLTAVYKEY